MSANLWAFLGVSVLVIVTPGPDTAMTIRNTLLGGRAGGFFTALGVTSGQAVWALASSAGIVALLAASEPLFLAVRLAGTIYLIVLGVQTLLTALRSRHSRSSVATDLKDLCLAPRTAYRQGAISNLGNPKMAVFFTSMLPQFVPQDGATFAPMALLGLMFCALTLAWLSAYSLAVAMAGGLLKKSGVRRALQAVTGAVLVALGLRLAAEHR